MQILDHLSLCRRDVLIATVLLSVEMTLAPQAQAGWPDRTITIVIPFGPGGGADIAARMVAPQLSTALGVPVVVENRAGAGGNIGINYAARAKPDGYTFMTVSSVFVVNPSLYEKAGYDAEKDFEPVINIGASPNVLVVPAKSEAKSFKEFVAQAKTSGGKTNWASGAVGSTPFLAGEVVKARTGIDMVHIPYPGGGPATQAAVAGQIDMLAASIGTVLPLIQESILRPIAQTGKTRYADLADVPTLAEVGLEGADTDTHQAMYAPAGTPREIIERVEQEVRKIIMQPDVQEKFRKVGLAVIAEGPDAMKRRVAEEVAKYRNIIEKAGLKRL